MNGTILTVGNAYAVFTMTAPRLPLYGETLISRGSYAFSAGGNGTNTSIAAARLGGKSFLCSRVGNDANGDNLKRILNENNVNTQYVKTDKFEQTGLDVYTVTSTNEYANILFPGANAKINEADIEASFTSYPDAVITQFNAKDDTVLYAAQNAASSGIPLFIDAAGIRHDFPLEKLIQAEVFSPNQREAEMLTGIKPDTLENRLRACIALCGMLKIKYVVLKLGDRGAYIYDGKYCDMVLPFPVTVVDRSGAGDAFTAALAVEYRRNSGKIIEAVRYANAVGALTVSRAGAVGSLPTDSEVRAML